MVEALPGCRLLTAVGDPRLVAELFKDHPVERLWTDSLPGARQHWRRYAPAIVVAWSTTRIRDVDVLVSSSHFAAKEAGRRFVGPHLCYCYTPMRAAWRPDLEMHRLRPSFRPFVQAGLPLVREWDRRSAARVTAFAGISTTVVDRIRRAYHRDARRIFPPVDVESFRTVERRPGKHFLAFGRLIPYKRLDLAVEVCSAKGYPLVVAGAGPDESRLLVALAGPSVRFVGRVDDERYREPAVGRHRRCCSRVKRTSGWSRWRPQAAGCPVVALAQGGALDTVRDGETGVLFSEPTAAGLAEGISALLARSWDADPIRAWASQFSEARFTREFREFVGPYAR